MPSSQVALHWSCSLLASSTRPWTFAQPTALKAYRYGNTYYVAVGDVADYYGLGPDTRGVINRAEYKTSFAQLEMEADRRDVLLNGVNHWLSAPILALRGQVSGGRTGCPEDAGSVLQPQRLRKPGAVHTVVIDPGPWRC